MFGGFPALGADEADQRDSLVISDSDLTWVRCFRSALITEEMDLPFESRNETASKKQVRKLSSNRS